MLLRIAVCALLYHFRAVLADLVQCDVFWPPHELGFCSTLATPEREATEQPPQRMRQALQRGEICHQTKHMEEAREQEVVKTVGARSRGIGSSLWFRSQGHSLCWERPHSCAAVNKHAQLNRSLSLVTTEKGIAAHQFRTQSRLGT